MPIPPLDIILELFLSILLPGFLCAAIVGWIVLRWKYVGIALFAGFVAANTRGLALPWFEWDRELGRILVVMLVSLFTMPLSLEKPWHRLIGMVWVGVCSSVLFFHEDMPTSHLVAGAVVSMLVYVAVVFGEQQLPGWNLAGLFMLTGLGVAIVMIHAHTARLCDVGLMWMASCAGMLMVAVVFKREVRGAGSLVAVLFPFLLYYGERNTESQVPWISFVLLAVAPMAGMLGLLNVKKGKRWLINVAWLALLAMAMGLAMRYETVMME